MKQSGIQTVSPKGCRHTAWKSLCLFLAAWLTALTLTACNAAQPIVPATVSPFDSYQSAATSEPAPYPIGDDSKTNPPNSQPSGTEPSPVPTTPSAVQTSAPPAASTVIQLSTIPPFSGNRMWRSTAISLRSRRRNKRQARLKRTVRWTPKDGAASPIPASAGN